MADGGIDPSHYQLERFLLTQLLVMVLPGVPAFYLPALLATPNDVSRFRRTGQRRDLNRPQFRADTLERRLQDPESDATRLLQALRHAMTIRGSMPSLHPDAELRVISKGRTDLVVLERATQGQSLFAVHNMTRTRLNFPLGSLHTEPAGCRWFDCLHGTALEASQRQLQLEPYDVVWLVRR